VQRVRGFAHMTMMKWFNIPHTLWTIICRDSGVICLLDSFERNHIEAAKERDVYCVYGYVIVCVFDKGVMRHSKQPWQQKRPECS